MTMDGRTMGRGVGLGIAALLVLAACGGDGGQGGGAAADAPAANTSGGVTGTAAAAETVTPTTGAADGRDMFLGSWTGPEGLSFVVERAGNGRYAVRNQDTLDEKSTFVAERVGDTLRFTRRGQAFAARPGTGTETGFKWLANKRDCLIVQAGAEGYCRD